MESPSIIPSTISPIRVRSGHRNDFAEVNQQGDFVLYWMTAFRRSRWNFALDRAIEWSRSLDRPLVVLEALNVDYRWACDRFHAFVVRGMRDNSASLSGIEGVTYYPYLERAPHGGNGLLAALSAKACVVVGDDFPSFFLPAQLRAACRAIGCRFELVDSNGLYPMHATDRVFSRAYDFRRHLQKQLKPHLSELPQAEPFVGKDLSPVDESTLTSITDRWPSVSQEELDAPDQLLASLPIDHSIRPVNGEPGGSVAAEAAMATFLDRRLSLYGEERNQPEQKAASELSGYLHWGHLSVHEVFAALVELEEWTPAKLPDKATGKREGWWGMSATAEAFLDELVTWREVGFNMTSKRRDYDQYDSLPVWARDTLEEHASDRREHVYTLEQFERAVTHDDLWNAAQRQLVREGRIHNYLRMLWGKKILHWSESPREALRILIELNNKYALDGRNPNSYSGIFWVLGRYDRAWGPERPIFGKIRYMTSDNTARKVRVKDYVRRYAADGERSLF